MPIFCEKWKIAPPHSKTAPLKRVNLRNWTKLQPQLWWRPFFSFLFWRSPNFGRKKALNFGFRPKNDSEFWRRPFFFWRSPNFGRKKALNFGFRPRNHSEFWRRPFFFFFFEVHLILCGKKLWISELSETFRLKFRTNRLKLIQDQWKLESRSFAHFSLFQNSPPFSKSWLRTCQHQVKASDLPHYDIFAPTKNSSFEVSDDVIACDLWFGSPPNQKSWLCLCYGNTQYKTLNKMCSRIKHKKIISQK